MEENRIMRILMEKKIWLEDGNIIKINKMKEVLLLIKDT